VARATEEMISSSAKGLPFVVGVCLTDERVVADVAVQMIMAFSACKQDIITIRTEDMIVAFAAIQGCAEVTRETIGHPEHVISFITPCHQVTERVTHCTSDSLRV
jgi:hypothetical protein